MKTIVAFAGIVLFAALFVCAAGERSLSPNERFVLTDKWAYELLPAELVCAPAARDAYWSPTGRSLLIDRESRPVLTPTGRQRFPGEWSLVTWNAASHRMEVVWKRPKGRSESISVRWMPESDIAFVAVSYTPAPTPGTPEPSERAALLWVDAASARMRPLAWPVDCSVVDIYPASGSAYVAVSSLEQQREALRLIRPDGTISPPVALPERVFPAEWSEDGRLFFLRQITRQPGQKPIITWYALDPRSGTIAMTPEPPKPRNRMDKEQSPLSTERGKTTVTIEGARVSVPCEWLVSATPGKLPRALICANAERAQLSPDGSFVSYFSQDAAWVRPIRRMTMAQYEEEMREWAIVSAKQVGIAVAMYTQDYDEKFPPADGFGDRVFPYIKDDNMLGEFVYTFHETAMGDIAAPAGTEIGYISGPGGRAVVYADGHIQWSPDRPPKP
jgi:hypothetical protein